MFSTAKNNLSEILKQRGYPTRNGNYLVGDDFLKSIGMSAYQFNRFVDNEFDITVTQMNALMSILKISQEDLYHQVSSNTNTDPVSRLPWASKS